MLTETKSLTFERTVPAAPKEVFRAFTAPSALRDWLCNSVDVDARKGGRVYFWWDSGYYTAGVFTSFEKDRGLAFTWRGPDEPEASQVSVEIGAHDNGSNVTVTHSGVGSGAEWAGAADKIKSIWESGLDNLEAVLETGIDLRFVRRPMFGLSDSDVLDDEIAARLGVPVKEGLALGGLVEGMGAEQAGLQKGDVVVRLAGRDIINFPSFTAALQEHQAGDRVEVVFYRGAEKHTRDMELSKRPTPDIPETPEGVAKAARAMYEQMNTELEKAFEGATEAEADYRPAPGEWSAKENLGHLLAIERDTQMWITTMLEDFDLLQAFHTNETPRIMCLVSAYPTLPVLFEELRRNEAITLAMVEALPAEVAGRKHLFRQVAQWLTGFDTHTKEHIGQIRKLLEAARG